MLHAAAIVMSRVARFYLGGGESGHIVVAKKTNRMLLGSVCRLCLEA